MLYTNKNSIGVTILRLFFCFTIIKNYLTYIPQAEFLFGKNAIFPYPEYKKLLKEYNIGFMEYPFYLENSALILLIILITFTLMYMFGILGRISGLLAFICIIIFRLRNGFILDGSDNVIQVIFPFLLFADNLQLVVYRKYDNFIKQFFNNFSQIFTYAIMVQVCYIYFFTGLAKHEGELWRNGTALYYTMRVQEFLATKYNILLTRNEYFVVGGTYFTLLWEIAFPFLIWFKTTKYYIMLGGLLLHIGIWIFMRIDNFSWVMISTYFIFITDNEYKKIINKIRSEFMKKQLTNYLVKYLNYRS